MKLYRVLCFLLLASNSQAALWNKNGKKNDKDNERRRLTEVPTSTVDVDAATGTVRQVISEEQEKAANAAQTCDGQMAQSLVNANEKMMNAQTERDEIFIQKTQALEQLAAMEKSLANLEEAKEKLERKADEVNQGKDEQVKHLADRLKDSQVEVAAEYEKRISDMAKAHVEELALMNDQMEASKASFTAQIHDLKAMIENNAKAVEETMRNSLKVMEDKHNEEMTKLEAQREKQERDAAETLAKKEQDAKATLKKVMDAKDKKINAAIGRAKKAQQEMLEAEEELTSWRATHTNRTYCNYTFMSEDLYWTSSKAYNKSAELTWNAYDGATRAAVKAHSKSKVAYEEAKVYTNKATVEGQKIYEKNVKPHYEKHVKPHYEKHVNPLVAKVSKFVDKEITPKLKEIKIKIDPIIAEVQKVSKKQFNALARKYAKACGSTYTIASDVAKKHELDFFKTSIAPAWKNSCNNPKDTLRGTLFAFLAVLLLPWTFIIIRLALRVVFLPLGIFFYVITLRFIFGSSKKLSATPTKKVGEVRAKKDVRVKKKKDRINSSQ